MKKIFAVVAFLISLNLQAQNAVGLRVGGTSGVTFKHYSGLNAYEFIIGAWPNDLTITGLYERYDHLSDDPGFSFYYGAGAHAAFNTYRRVYYYDSYRDRWWYAQRGGFGVGINGIIGLEYAFREIPLALSLDLKPFIEINTDDHIYWSPDPGLGVKIKF
ncbi:MAG TPA: hypothetical protein VD905_05665 [Flavobacteriales bacterium]|nr:hypothetical protein [Flavobacteriales bacterium]